MSFYSFLGSEEDFINNFQHEKLTRYTPSLPFPSLSYTHSHTSLCLSLISPLPLSLSLSLTLPLSLSLSRPYRLEYEACLSQSDYTPYKPNKILSKDLLKKNFNILSSCFGEYFRHGSLGLRHIDKGIYYDQFDRWFQNFHRSQFLIISYEQWLSNPIQYYEKILKFFGHELYGPHGFQSHEDLKFLNLNFLSTSNEKKTTFSDELIHELECYYQKYNQRLNEMLGEEILKIKNLTCEKYESQGGEENKRKMMRTSSSNGEDVDKDQERIKEKKKRYPAPSTSSSIRRN